MLSRRFFLLLVAVSIVTVCQTAGAQQGPAPFGYPPPETLMPQQTPTLSSGYGPSSTYASSDTYDQAGLAPTLEQPTAQTNPMLWQQYQALQTGGAPTSDCQSCSGNGTTSYDRCGCNAMLFPWIKGPGSCDQWCVGPKWDVDAGGLMMFRDDADWARVQTAFAGAATLEDQFEYGPGGRVFVTGYNDAGYGIQVGYEGINDWNANLALDLGGGDVREFDYETNLNSIEINFLTNNPSPWKLFSGFRYVQLGEDFVNSQILNKPIPAPVNGGTAPVAFVDLSTNNLLKNRLFGFQIGGRRDAWEFGNRLTLQTFANAGVYSNKFRREDVDLTITTIITGDDLATADDEFSRTTSTTQTTTRTDINEIAFVGEAGVSAAWRLNHCTAVRAGYQILALDGVTQGLEASFTPGFSGDTVVFHGVQFGVEYRR